jgi:ribulose-5-phosphate 4-epimerase/fuculose-1-phosphate aldolase
VTVAVDAATAQLDVVRLCVEICARGLTGPVSSGNVSVYDASERVVAITARGIPLTRVDAADVVQVEVDDAWAPLGWHRGAPSSELSTHLAVYRDSTATPAAVLHLHSPFAVSASVLALDRLPFVHPHQTLLGDELTPIVPFAPPGSSELAAAAGAALADGTVSTVLLGNHGALVAAPEVDDAVPLAELLEDVCRLVVLGGCRLRTIPASKPSALSSSLDHYRRDLRRTT